MSCQVLRERIGLAAFAGVLMPIGPVGSRDERRGARRARRRTPQERVQPAKRAEDQRPHHLDHSPLLAPLPHRRVAQVGGNDLHGLGWPARPRTLRPGRLDAVDRVARRLLRGVLVAGDQQIESPPGPVADRADQPLAGLAMTLARHQGQESSALGINRGGVPVVLRSEKRALQVRQWTTRIRPL
jgi:hypothetical protein